MSKMTYHEMKQQIRDQQAEISQLKQSEKLLHRMLQQMRHQHLQQYSDMMLALFHQMMDDALSEQQAGNLMLLLTGLMLDEGV